jgi:hypothetical protein
MNKTIVVSVYDKNTGEIVVDNKKCNELDLIVLLNRYTVSLYQLDYKIVK